MGSVPPEDFADSFGFPLDLIKVTENVPLFPAEEAAHVIARAVAEGVDKNEFQSGKYQLAGDWLVNLPQTREWFNGRLESTFFPLLAYLFPEVISSPSVIRAHSVSLLKYNSSHPRTDVHIDNGILAMTLAMTARKEYVGGGTFFEHMGLDNILEMDIGHGTFRPGSVRHGGHRVDDGTRYVLGAFLLLEDRVEHVRRLKNRGSDLRRSQDFAGAIKHFEWALALNPKCTTCLKDWAEILHRQKQFSEAEEKILQALSLVEYQDSDALFSLGVVLSELGRDDESIDAYQKSVSLNADDAELCYNLGVKFGERGNTKEEMRMYAKATKANPNIGGAWLNWGTALAEGGNIDDVRITTQASELFQCSS
jgi:tetratricopeptide (TPR) repeat protein